MALKLFVALLVLSVVLEFSGLCQGQYHCIFSPCKREVCRISCQLTCAELSVKSLLVLRILIIFYLLNGCDLLSEIIISSITRVVLLWQNDCLHGR